MEIPTVHHTSNGTYLVFSDELAAIDFVCATEIKYECYACFDGYMNAIKLEDCKGN